MIIFKTAFIIESKPKNSNHRLFKNVVTEVPCCLVAEIELCNTSTTRNNKVNRVKVYARWDNRVFEVLSQNELHNLLSQCVVREDYQPVFMV